MTRTEHKKTHHWKTSLNHSQSKLVAHTEVFKISQDLSIFYSIPFYTITWLLCVFSLVVAHDLLEDWRIDCVINVSGLVFVSFHAPKIPQDLEFLLYKTNRFHFSVLCSVIDAQRTSEREKNSILSLVGHFFVLTTFWRHLCIYNWTDNGKMECIC